MVENGANVGKVTALSIDPVTPDNIINAAENTGFITITGQVTGKFAAGDTVTLTVKGAQVPGTVGTDGKFSINVAAADLVADTDTQIEGSITGTGGSKASALQNYAVDTTPPAGTIIVINAITGDDFLSATEQGGTVTVTGSVTGEFRAGDKVTINVGGTDYTAAVDASGQYSIAGVPGAQFVAGFNSGDTAIDAKILASDSSSNSATFNATPRPFTLDTNTEALKTALTLDPVAGNNIIDATEGAITSTTLTGKATGAFAAGDVVTLTVNDTKFTGTVNANGVYSIAVTTADLKADTDTRVEARIAATVPGSATKQTAEAAQDYVVETGTTVGKLTAISLDAVTADNIINSNEAAGNITLTGKVTGAFAATDIVTVMVNGTGYTGTAGNGTFSIVVAGSELIADSNTTIEASVTGTGGTLANAVQNYAVDTTPPSPAGTTLTIDAITGDDFLSASEQAGSVTITGTVTGEFRTGDIVTVVVDGTNYTAAVNASGQYSVAGVPGSKLVADFNTSDKAVSASILASDSSSNTATISATPRTFTLDTNTEALKTALTLDPVAGNNIIDTTEGAITSTTLTGKATGAFAAGDVVTLTVNDTKFTGTVDAAGVYSIAVTTADLKADTDTRVEARIAATVPASAAKQTAEAAQDYVVEDANTAGKLTAISLDSVTADNIINAAENTGNIAITGTVTGKFSAGDLVTLKLSPTQAYSGTVNSAGNYSINVPAADLVADADTQIEASVTGTGGTLASALQNYAVVLNVAPINTVPAAQTVAEDTQLAITGISVSDADGNLVTTQISVLNGNLNVSLSGGATITAGANNSATMTLSGTQVQINAALATIQYKGAANYNGNDTLTVLSTDGQNVTDSDTVAITVTAVDDNASIGGTTTGVATEDTLANASGTLTVTDGDAGQATLQTPSNLAGTYGNFALNTATGVWTYTLDNSKAATQALKAGQQVFDTLTVASADGSATKPITVTITGTNDVAVISGPATGELTEDSTTTVASGTLTVTDVDTGEAAFATPTTLAGTYGNFTFNTATGEWTYTLDNTKAATNALNTGDTVFDTVTVKSTDGTGSQEIKVTIRGANEIVLNTAPVPNPANGLVNNPLQGQDAVTVSITDNASTNAGNFVSGGTTVAQGLVRYTLSFSGGIDAATLTEADIKVSNGTLKVGSLTRVGTTNEWTVDVQTPASGNGATSVSVMDGAYTGANGLAGQGNSATQGYGTGQGASSTTAVTTGLNTIYTDRVMLDLADGSFATFGYGSSAVKVDRFDASGKSLGQISLPGLGAYTSAVKLSNGDIMLVTSTDNQYVYAQRLDSNFNLVGSSFKVSTSILPVSNPINFAISDLTGGGFVVTYWRNCFTSTCI